MVEVELVEGGHSLRVTNANKARFVRLLCQRRLLRGAEKEVQAMAKVSESDPPIDRLADTARCQRLIMVDAALSIYLCRACARWCPRSCSRSSRHRR